MFDFWILPIMQWRLIDVGCFMLMFLAIVGIVALVIEFVKWYSLAKLREKQ